MKLMRRHKSYPHHLDMLSGDKRVSLVSLAYHEAGHAVFCWRNDRSLGRFGVSINPHDRVGLCTQGWIMKKQKYAHLYGHFRDDREFDYTDLEFLISGPAAEDRFLRSIARPSRRRPGEQ
jgi:hypothetical protein